MKKRLLGLALMVMALVAVLTIGASAAEDSVDNPVEITDAASLNAFLTNTTEVYGKLTTDITYDTGSVGVMNVSSEKDLNMNDKTITVPNDVTNAARPINLTAGADLTMYGGFFVAGTESEKGAYGAISASNYCYSTIYLHDMTFTNMQSNAQCLRLVDVSSVTIDTCTFNSTSGGAFMNYNAGDTDGSNIINCTVNQYTGVNYNSVAVATAWGMYGDSIINVHSGTYTCEGYGAYVMSTGGTINIYGGEWQADSYVLKSDSGYSDAVANINVYGGEFDGKLGVTQSSGSASITLYGGTFENTGLTESAFSDYVADHCSVSTAGSSTSDYVFTVTADPYVATIGEEGYYSLAAAVEDADANDTITIIADIELPSSDNSIDIDKSLSFVGAEKEDGTKYKISNDEASISGGTLFNVDAKVELSFENLAIYVMNLGIELSVDADGSVVDIDNCYFSALDNDHTRDIYYVRGDSSTDNVTNYYYSLSFTNNVVEHGSNIADHNTLPVHIKLGEDSYLYMDGNTFIGYTGMGSSNTILVWDDNAEITITNNTFSNMYRTINVRFSEAMGQWTFENNKFIDVTYALEVATANGNNNGFDTGYNYFGDGTNDGTKIAILNQTEGELYDNDANPSNLVFYPYYLDAAFTTLIYDAEGTSATLPTFDSISTSVGNGYVTVKWTVDNGGSAITEYALTVDGVAIEEEIVTDATSYTVTGLTNGTEYAFVLTATNDVGSTDSEEVTGTPKSSSSSSNTGTLVTDTSTDDGEDDVTTEETEGTTTDADEDTTTTTATVGGFTDVTEDEYYAESVEWAVDNEITTGTTGSTFSPDEPGTRAHVLTFLYRAFGSPETDGENIFDDVDPDSYYGSAVNWGIAMGITDGVGNDLFGTDNTCTRAHIITFMWRAAGSPESEGDHDFTDVDADSYYEMALLWAVENGITNGMGDGTFGVDEPCTRAQIVTFLYRFLA